MLWNSVYSSGVLQSLLFRNVGFQNLRDIKHLDDYEPRYDPTVTPVVGTDAAKSSAKPSGSGLSAPTKRRDGPGGYYTSADYHALYKSGELTPTDVVEALLPLIRRDTDPAGEHSTAFLDSKVEVVRAAAEASTARYKNGTPLGPLDGVPVAVKDEVDLEGYKRTLASKLDFTPKTNQTSWCVKQWEDAGAVVIGKTTMHELGLGETTPFSLLLLFFLSLIETELPYIWCLCDLTPAVDRLGKFRLTKCLDTSNNNPCVGTPRNPHNPGYYTGGSSGGSGYAVAAGIVPIALGADGGGSIRVPSNFCGIYGLKTSHGRVSGRPTVGLATTTGVMGPMASSLDDLAMSYQVMAKPDEGDSASSGFPDPLRTRETAATRPRIIGICQDWISRSDPEVRALFDKAMGHYRNQQQAYTVVDISIPYLPEGQKAHALTILAEIASGVTREQVSQLTPANKILLSVGGTQTAAQDFLAAQKLRNLLMRHLAHLFQKHPGLVIATPTTPFAGWKIAHGEADLTHGVSDANTSLRSMEYVYLANFTGCPAISRPMGYAVPSSGADGSQQQMPVGLMGMGEWGSEEALIEWARDGEGVLDVDVEESGATNGAKTAGDEGGGEDEAVMVCSKGVRIPRGPQGKWADAIKLARERRA